MFARILAVLALSLLPVAAQAQVTLGETQDECDAWFAPREAGIWTDWDACALADSTLRTCHPVLSASVLPNTDPGDSAAATVTNDDPGYFVPNVCDPNCYDDTRGTWAIAAIDIPVTSPCALRINVQTSPSGQQIVLELQYDGTPYVRGIGRGAFAGFAWRDNSPPTP